MRGEDGVTRSQTCEIVHAADSPIHWATVQMFTPFGTTHWSKAGGSLACLVGTAQRTESVIPFFFFIFSFFFSLFFSLFLLVRLLFFFFLVRFFSRTVV